MKRMVLFVLLMFVGTSAVAMDRENREWSIPYAVWEDSNGKIYSVAVVPSSLSDVPATIIAFAILNTRGGPPNLNDGGGAQGSDD